MAWTERFGCIQQSIIVVAAVAFGTAPSQGCKICLPGVIASHAKINDPARALLFAICAMTVAVSSVSAVKLFYLNFQ
jgi:hypothetical protein